MQDVYQLLVRHDTPDIHLLMSQLSCGLIILPWDGIADRTVISNSCGITYVLALYGTGITDSTQRGVQLLDKLYIHI